MVVACYKQFFDIKNSVYNSFFVWTIFGREACAVSSKLCIKAPTVTNCILSTMRMPCLHSCFGYAAGSMSCHWPRRTYHADQAAARPYICMRIFCAHAAGKLSPQQVAHVKAEIDMLIRFKHEGIARCRGTWEDDRHLYMVQEYGIRGDLFTEMFSER